MDRGEVIKWLKIMKANLNTFPEVSGEKKIEALAEAIRLLKNEQPENSTGSDDCISREQALDLLCKKCPVYDCIRKCLSYKAIEKMPSATPIRPKGHWKTDRQGDMQCSRCRNQRPYFIGYTSEGCEVHGELTPFCPNCGADMRISEEHDV